MSIKIYNRSPFTFGQPVCYFKPEDIHERILNSGNVSSSSDVSGHGYTLTQAAPTSQPALGSLNGRDTWVGDGVDNFLACSVPLPAQGTIFLVVDRTAGAPSYIMAGDHVHKYPNFLSGFNPGGGAAAFEWLDDGMRATFSVSATGFHVLAVKHDDSAGTPNTIGYFDGAQAFSGDSANWSGRNIVGILGESAGVNPHAGAIAGGPLVFPRVFAAFEVALQTRFYQNRFAI